MNKIKLGRTGLEVGINGFGAIPIQRISFDESRSLLQKAYDNGINFFDTARAYSDSEEKIGYALSKQRSSIVIATKSKATTKDELFSDLKTSLKMLKTDYIDIYQLHNPDLLPDPDDKNSAYHALLELKSKGIVRFIGLTSHILEVASNAVAANLFDTLQFPINTLSSESDLQLIQKCKEKDLGLIAMKILSGGLITNAASAYAFIRQFPNVVPIWGIQRECELDEFISFSKNPPCLNNKLREVIKNDQVELAGKFCRACGYCMPCPVGIPIPTAARMSLLLRRKPYQNLITDEWKEKMNRIEDCTECGECKSKCPYKLDTPKLLASMLENYRQFIKDEEGGHLS